MSIRQIIIVFLMLISIQSLFGQVKNCLSVIDGDHSKKIYYRNQLEKKNKISNIYYKKLGKGYFFVEIDSISPDTIKIMNGTQYKWIEIDYDNKIRKLKLEEISHWMKKNLQADVNKGFPFSSSKLTFIEFKGNKTVKGTLVYNKGKYSKINNIHIKGDLVPKNLVSNIIGIHDGEPYQENRIMDIDKNLENSAFINIIKPSELIFTPEGVDIYCYVKKKNASSVNGILGLQPNNSQKVLGLTGEFNLNLLNSMNRGEKIKLDWKSVLPQTSSLNGNINFPYLFNSPFGIDGNLKLYKRDSTFFEITSNLDIQFRLNQKFVLSGKFESYTNNKFQNSNVDFMNNANIRGNFFGLNLNYSNLDFPINPSKGFSIIGSVLGGIRTVDNNNSNKNNVLKTNFDFKYFIKLEKRHIIKLQSTHQSYLTDSIYSNERFRIGGLKTIRGFNEESIFSNNYSLNSFEYRFKLDNDSYTFSFFDVGLIWDRTSQNKFETPYSFGLGFAYNTSIGFFNIVGAYGISKNQPLKIGDAKIHFGYVAFF